MESGRAAAMVPRCPFCGAGLPRPAEIGTAMEEAQGGTCNCGAIFLVDPTGKNVGTVMVQALGMAADMAGRDMSTLVPDQDYEDAVLSYDWRNHRSLGISAGYMDGYGRLYMVKLKKRER